MSKEPEAPPLAWTSFPLRDDFPRSLLLVGIVLGFSVGVGITMQSAALGVVSLVVLVGATWRYVTPVRYTLTAEHAGAQGVIGPPATRAWHTVKNVYYHPGGAFLSPFAEPSALDSFRGVYLRYAGNREAVEAFVRSKVTEPSH